MAVEDTVILLFRINGSGVLNPEAVFLHFVTVAFLLFLAPAGSPNPAGQSLTLN